MATTVRKASELLELLENGWELGNTGGIDAHYWVQKGGLGRGGDSRNVDVRAVERIHHMLKRSDNRGPGLSVRYEYTPAQGSQ